MKKLLMVGVILRDGIHIFAQDTLREKISLLLEGVGQ